MIRRVAPLLAVALIAVPTALSGGTRAQEVEEPLVARYLERCLVSRVKANCQRVKQACDARRAAGGTIDGAIWGQCDAVTEIVR